MNQNQIQFNFHINIDTKDAHTYHETVLHAVQIGWTSFI